MAASKTSLKAESEIKETVAQQHESVKEALDWREHFKKQPLAWSIAAAGVGFFVGYGIAAALKGKEDKYVPSVTHAYAAQPIIGESSVVRETERTNGGHPQAPGLLARFKETTAYERLSNEVNSLGDRLLVELSATAQKVVLPVLLNRVKHWIGLDLSNKAHSQTARVNKQTGATTQHSSGASYRPVLERPI